MSQILNHPEIEKLVNGDQRTIKSLYQSLFPKVTKYIKRNQGTQSDSEEVFHNALFQLIVRAKIKGVHIGTSFEGYVYVICKNIWLKELNNRKKMVRNEVLSERVEEQVKTLESIVFQERWDLFEEKMLLLSENCRSLLRDFFNQVSYDEIVKKFKYSSENVAFQRVFKCKKRLAELVKADPKYQELLT